MSVQKFLNPPLARSETGTVILREAFYQHFSSISNGLLGNPLFIRTGLLNLLDQLCFHQWKLRFSSLQGNLSITKVLPYSSRPLTFPFTFSFSFFGPPFSFDGPSFVSTVEFTATFRITTCSLSCAFMFLKFTKSQALSQWRGCGPYQRISSLLHQSLISACAQGCADAGCLLEAERVLTCGQMGFSQAFALLPQIMQPQISSSLMIGSAQLLLSQFYQTSWFQYVYDDACIMLILRPQCLLQLRCMGLLLNTSLAIQRKGFSSMMAVLNSYSTSSTFHQRSLKKEVMHSIILGSTLTKYLRQRATTTILGFASINP